jgi:hypothetical protein
MVQESTHLMEAGKQREGGEEKGERKREGIRVPVA